MYPSQAPLERVVITGLGCVSPAGVGIKPFWQATRSGKSQVRTLEGIDVSDLPVKIAGQARDFDPDDVVSKKEQRHVPRVVMLALKAAEEALQDSGLDPKACDLETRQKFGVLLGTGGAALAFAEQQFRQYYLEDPRAVSLYAIPSATPGAISSELSMRFDLRGASHVLSTGCTSSTDAIGHAYSMIKHGTLERALVGGTDAPIAHGIMTGFCLMKIMTPSWNDAPERASRPFDLRRDGFVIAEGAWIFVLEALTAAKARGATIYGEILGYGSTCEAFHRVRLNESGEEPARAMQLALDDAQCTPEQMDYLNLHGTSTQLNDRIETQAIHRTFGPYANLLAASSTKSVFGHPQGASGAMGIAAALLSMRDQYLPPTINVDEQDPDCDLDVVANQGRSAIVRRALCNCIGFGSKNSALVIGQLEDAL